MRSDEAMACNPDAMKVATYLGSDVREPFRAAQRILAQDPPDIEAAALAFRDAVSAHADPACDLGALYVAIAQMIGERAEDDIFLNRFIRWVQDDERLGDIRRIWTVEERLAAYCEWAAGIASADLCPTLWVRSNPNAA